MEREELIAYAMNFASFVVRSDIGKHINKIVLFGSVARNDFDKDSDIDIFIEIPKDYENETDNLLSLFLKSEIHRTWELKGLKNSISIKIGNLDEWDLKRSIISDGIMLYGKFKESPDKGEQYCLIEPAFDKFKRSKKVSLWRELYGYKQKVGKKVYETAGIVKRLNGKRINSGIIIPSDKARDILDFLDKEKISYTIREIWSDNI